MRPFLKWAGSKYSVLKQIQAVLDTLPTHGRLIEPFVGSGAVFLNTHYPRYLLSDTNADLIHLYQTLQSEGEPFIRYCQGFFTEENNTSEAYYRLRHTFNTTRDPRFKSALFLYLNRHGFNGLCRYNAQNGFNVPFGRYKKPYFPEKEMQAWYQKSQGAVFLHADFVTVMEQAKPGDIVYCDPPYVPLSDTANFTSYSQGGFRMAQQETLAELAVSLSQRGVMVLISNHSTPFTHHAYKEAQRIEFGVQRYISCNGANRGKAMEILALFNRPAHQAFDVAGVSSR